MTKRLETDRDAESVGPLVGGPIGRVEPLASWVRWRWFSASSALGLVFMLVWCAGAFRAPGTGGLFFLAFGLWGLYSQLAQVVNQTEIRVTATELRVFHRPLPFRRRLQVDKESIRRVFHEDRHQSGENGTTVFHDLFAEGTSGQRLTLVEGLRTASEAAFLQEFLERRLGVVPALRPSSGSEP